MHVDKYEQMWLIVVSITLGIFFAALLAGAVIFGVRNPDPGGFINPLELDQTEFANPGVRDMGNNEYEVTMVGYMWYFAPSTIRVPVGAEVTFNITSGDVTHGFIIEDHNINFELVPGHIARQTVTFHEEGEFRMICHEYCGRGHHLMHAVIIVEDEASTTALGE